MSLRTMLLGLGASFALGCQPNAFTTTQRGETTIQGNPLGAVFTAFPAIGSFGNIDFSRNQDFKNQGISKSQLTSVTVKEIKLKILSPDNQDFSFLDSLSFSARTGDTEVPLADKQNIASLKLPAPHPTLEMDLKPAELLKFVTAPTMSIEVSGTGHSPPQDTRLEADVTLQVEFKLF